MPPSRDKTHPNESAFPSGAGGPVLRALANANIRSMAQLAKWTERDVAALHGVGPKGIRLLKEGLAEQGRQYKRSRIFAAGAVARHSLANTSRHVMHADTAKYNAALSPADKQIGDLLAQAIDKGLAEAENKIWHAHPVWFLDDNPIVGYSKLKHSVRLLFWSVQSFDEASLANEGSFKAAEARYTDASQVNTVDLQRWLGKARDIQWDYKNIMRRKGKLERLK